MNRIIPVLLAAFLPVLPAVAAEPAPAPLTLEQAVDIALKNSGRLRVAGLQAAAGLESSYQARAALLPSLSVGGRTVVLDERPTMSIAGLSVPVGERTTTTAEATLSQLLWDFGRSHAAWTAALRGYEAGRLDYERLRQATVCVVTEQFVGLAMARRMVEVTGKAVQSAEEHLKQTTAFHEQGLVDRSDLLRAKLQLARDRQGRIRAENAAAMAESTLARTLSLPPGKPLVLAALPTEAQQAVPTLEACWARALAGRPDLLAVEQRAIAARKALQAAKAAPAPALRAFAGGQWTDAETAARDHSWNAGLSVDMQLLSGGRLHHARKEADLRLQAAEEALSEARLDVRLEVEQARLGRLEAAELLAVSSSALSEAEEQLRRALDLYAQQMATSTDVLAAQTARTAALVDHETALHGLRLAAARLELASGGDLAGTVVRPPGERPGTRDGNKEKP